MNSQRHPLQKLTTQLKKHNAFTSDNFTKIAAFYLKLLLQEPFRIVEKARCEKKIRAHILEEDPIFIIGHWRSGTSFLQYLLSKDPQFGYMNKFQVVFPDIFLRSEDLLKPLINRIPRTLNLIRDAQNMSINLELDSPSEIEIALTTMISPASLHWGHIFPEHARTYFDKYLFFENVTDSEIRQWEKDYRYLIKKTSLKRNGRQLLIKSPGNASRINKLLQLYPDARFIFIHRNPYDVFYSTKKLWNTLLDNLALQDFSQQQMEEEIIRTYKKLMGHYLQQRDNIPDTQLAEVRFDDFVSEPVQVLKKVYERLQLDGVSKAVPRFHHFLEHQTEGKSSSYDYETDILDKINNHWQFAFKQWNYSIIDSTEHAEKQQQAGN